MASPKKSHQVFERKGFAECMALSKLPDAPGPSDGAGPVKRFMGRWPAWQAGAELPWHTVTPTTPSLQLMMKGMTRNLEGRAYGGVVYAQSSLAAARVVEEEDAKAAVPGGKRNIQCIHGVFTNPGLTDRPFIYEVSSISSGRSFSTRQVQVRQTAQSSSTTRGPFPESDADLPLGKNCFTCLTTFKRSVKGPADVQAEASVQERFASILSQRAADEWEVSPQIDVDSVMELFPDTGHGAFPMLDMYKVDMTEYNANKIATERRQLILYRPLEPIPADDVNGHIVCHAFEADRNGLIMLENHLGWGWNTGPVGSLTYSFYVHVNADEAVMKGDGWWVQELCWPRVSAGRGMMESKIWSPEGKHVASGYQDGMVLPYPKAGMAKM